MYISQTVCPPGYYCVSGVQVRCTAGYYCPYSSMTDFVNNICPIGKWSPPGAISCLDCFQDHYGNTPGLTIGTCTGNCTVSCPPGSTSASSQLCPSGSYCNDAGNFTCRAGYYCVANSVLPQKCDVGKWSSDGASTCQDCDGGSYGMRSQLTVRTCDGPCSAGYFCPPGSTNSTAVLCPAGSVCPSGTSDTNAQTCPAGSFCPPGLGAVNSSYVCPAGTFSGPGRAMCMLCSGGHFCSSANQTSDNGQPCTAGYFCPPGSTAMTPCGNASVYCKLGASQPTVVDPGFYSIGSVNGSMQTSTVQCPMGSYCNNGVKRPCPAGTYRDTMAATVPADCAQCPSGSYCGVGASSPTSCGTAAVYCPGGSPAPMSVISGFYSYASPNASNGYDSQEACPLGSFCQGGVAMPCSGGRYANATGLSACLAPCPSGYYCPSGTSLPLPCGNRTVYCLSGSSSATLATAGYYTANPAVANNDSTMTMQVICMPGSYCSLGQAFPCSPGTYRASVGGSSAADCLSCPPGYFCGTHCWCARRHRSERDCTSSSSCTGFIFYKERSALLIASLISICCGVGSLEYVRSTAMQCSD